MTNPTSSVFPSGTGFLFAARMLGRRVIIILKDGVLARRHRKVVAELLALDDYMLRDIGVSRQDVESALATPMYRDASWRLAERAVESRDTGRARAEDGLRWARLMQSSVPAPSPAPKGPAEERRPSRAA